MGPFSGDASVIQKPIKGSVFRRRVGPSLAGGNIVGKTVIFYRTADGKYPVQEFLDSLPGKAAQKVTWVLNLIEDLDVVPSTYSEDAAEGD